MKKFALTLIAALGISSAGMVATAFAEDVELTAPRQAGSLHAGALDMVAYRTDLHDGAFEVTATFRARNTQADPQRVMMRLEDKDEVHFSMPSEPLTLYTFARAGDAVVISARQARVELAAQ